MISLDVLAVHQWPVWRELRLEALREAPHAFGSTLDEWQGAGDVEHRWRARLSNVPLNLIARINGACAGMVSATASDENNTVELISMWVAPFAVGRGSKEHLE